jgi:hypothetical protein
MRSDRRPFLRLVTDDFCQAGSHVELIETIRSREGQVPSGTVGEVTKTFGECLVVRFYLSPLDGRRGAPRLFAMERREVRRVDCSPQVEPIRQPTARASVDHVARFPGQLGALRLVPALTSDGGEITHDSTYGQKSAASARGLW